MKPKLALEKDDLALIRLLLLEVLLQKRRECNLETHFHFLDCEKAFDKVRTLPLFRIVQARNIYNPFLTEIYNI
jgi:hypothetical protein